MKVIQGSVPSDNYSRAVNWIHQCVGTFRSIIMTLEPQIANRHLIRSVLLQSPAFRQIVDRVILEFTAVVDQSPATVSTRLSPTVPRPILPTSFSLDSIIPSGLLQR